MPLFPETIAWSGANKIRADGGNKSGPRPDLLRLRPHLDGRPYGAADDFARHNQLHAAILLPAG